MLGCPSLVARLVKFSALARNWVASDPVIGSYTGINRPGSSKVVGFAARDGVADAQGRYRWADQASACSAEAPVR
jgi:hypothetical protein